MAVDGPNFQGAAVRQVVVHADAAIQSQLVRRETPPTDSVVRPLAHLGDRLQVERNQNIGEDLFVQKQDENQKYSAGDALNGNGRQDPKRERRRSRDGEETSEEPEAAPEGGVEEWSPLGDPREAQIRLLDALAALSLADSPEVFGSFDRHQLSALLRLDGAGTASNGLMAYRRQTVQIQPGPEAFRMTVQGAQAAVERYAAGMIEDRETARKLISLARQGIRSESRVGRELSAFLDDALLETSRADGTGALRAVGLLALVESAISLWRESQNVGTVLPWSLR